MACHEFQNKTNADISCREEALMEKLPADLKKAIFYTDKFPTYNYIIVGSSIPSGKESGKTGYIERFNRTIRQRCAGLVRKTLSFSKKIENHIEMIKIFICEYNKNLRSVHI